MSGAGSKPQVSQLIATPHVPSAPQLRAFEGTNTSEEVHGTYTVVARNGRLAVEIPTRSAIVLQPLFTDAFGREHRRRGNVHQEPGGRCHRLHRERAGHPRSVVQAEPAGG